MNEEVLNDDEVGSGSVKSVRLFVERGNVLRVSIQRLSL